jgi:hypothetical protein
MIERKSNQKELNKYNKKNIIISYYMSTFLSNNNRQNKINSNEMMDKKNMNYNRMISKNTPLIFLQPFNIIVFLSFFSPIIIATIVTATSFMSQNANGFIYLGFLLAAVVIRSFIYMISGSSQTIKHDGTICSSIQYSEYGNPTFSCFVIAFTIMYISLPMFMNNNVNYFVFSILIVYFFMDVFIKVFKKCITSYQDLVVNILFGLSLGATIVSLMYIGGSGQYLFFDGSSSSFISNETNGIKCNMPTKQTFKCSVYKNGQLVNTTTTSS